MKSYTQLRNLFGTLTNNSESATLTLADELINDSVRAICSLRPWHFLQKSSTISTVASTQFYDLPAEYSRLIHVSVIQGTTTWNPVEIESREEWDRINQVTSYTSDFPQYYHIFNKRIGFWPKPTTAVANAITIYYRKTIADMSVADYSTGTVDIITNASTTVTGASTVWASPMAGRFLRVTPTNVAATAGDGFWYEVSSVTSSTVLVLTRNYAGTSLTTGAAAAYTIGQMSPLPDAFQDLPLHRALMIYFTSVEPEATRAGMYKTMYEEGLVRLKEAEGSKTLTPVLYEGWGDREIINPNLLVNL